VQEVHRVTAASFVPPSPPQTDTPADPTATVAATSYQHQPGERMDGRWLPDAYSAEVLRLTADERSGD